MDRRGFLRRSAGMAALTTLPITLVDIAQAGAAEDFSFAFISDAHLQQVRGREFVRRWDDALRLAIDEANQMGRKADFVVFGGDLTHAGTPAELDHGAELLSALKRPVRHVVGEHDYHRDLGQGWTERFGAQYYSFDHKGVHFVVVNSVLAGDTGHELAGLRPEDRLRALAAPGNPDGKPFTLGARQRAWLARDLAAVGSHTPVVVFSHAPLQKIHRGWNFWNEDADQVQRLLARFDRATVVYGHVHQVQYGQQDNIQFHSVAATAWPTPFPLSATEGAALLPRLSLSPNLPMNRAAGQFERDVTGWQLIDLHSGNPVVNHHQAQRGVRTVSIDRRSCRACDQYSSQSSA
jgi:3',5'-cyclic-AMP phosphodiesterase